MSDENNYKYLERRPDSAYNQLFTKGRKIRAVVLWGAKDPVHLEYAIRQAFVVLTADHEDFEVLHNLIQTSGGRHPGILIVRFDDAPKHDMKSKHITQAVRKLESSGPSWENA